MDSADILKVWMFYRSDHPGVLHAFTATKDFKTRFEQQRKPNSFIIEKIKMDEIEFALFSNANQKKMLIETPIGVGVYGPVLKLIATYEEEADIETFCCRWEDNLDNAYRMMREIPWKKKYRKLFDKVLQTHVVKKAPDGSELHVSTCDLLAVARKVIDTL